MAIKIIESEKKISFNRPFDLKRFLAQKVYTPPLLFDPAPENIAALIDKHRNELGYDGDPYHPKKPGGFIYQSFVYAAKVVEQREQLFRILLSSNPDKKHEVWKRVIVEKAPMNMFMNTDNLDIDVLTFIPCFQIIHRPEEVENQNWVCRIGVPSHEVGVPKPLRYQVFEAQSLKSALEYAYRTFKEYRDREAEILGGILSRKYVQIPKNSLHAFAATQIKNHPEHEVYFTGGNPMVLRRVDPHQQYIVMVLDENDLDNAVTIPFEASTPMQAVRKAEVVRSLFQFDNELECPDGASIEILYAYLDLYSYSEASIYQGSKVSISGKTLVDYEAVCFMGNEKPLIVLFASRDGVEPITGNIVALVLSGSIAEFQQKLDPSLQLIARFPKPSLKQITNPLPQGQINLHPLGWITGSDGAFHVIKVSGKTAKPVDTFKRMPFDNHLTVAGMAFSI